MIILNAVHFSNFAKFRENLKNSAAQLEIPRPMKNCEPQLLNIAVHK